MQEETLITNQVCKYFSDLIAVDYTHGEQEISLFL